MGVYGFLVQGVYILTVSGVLSPFVSLGHKWTRDPWHCEDGVWDPWHCEDGVWDPWHCEDEVCIEAGDLVICFNS